MKLWLVTLSTTAYVVAETREEARDLADDLHHEITRDNALEADEVELITYRPDEGDCASLPYVEGGMPERTVGEWYDLDATERAALAARTDAATMPLALPYSDGRVERVAKVVRAPEEVTE